MRRERFHSGEIIKIQTELFGGISVQLNGISIATILSADKREIHYTVFPNGFVGLEAILTERALFTYEALTDVDLLSFSIEEFKSFLKRESKIFINLQRFVRSTFSEHRLRRVDDKDNLVKFLWIRAKRYGITLSVYDLERFLGGPVNEEFLSRFSLFVNEEGILVEKPKPEGETHEEEGGGGTGDVDSDL
ncbi:MAG: hypothetical protein PWP37_662 [Thermotogota bacterium]|nr:hypothetical protein [Thermotogota bacterium]